MQARTRRELVLAAGALAFVPLPAVADNDQDWEKLKAAFNAVLGYSRLWAKSILDPTQHPQNVVELLNAVNTLEALEAARAGNR